MATMDRLESAKPRLSSFYQLLLIVFVILAILMLLAANYPLSGMYAYLAAHLSHCRFTRRGFIEMTPTHLNLQLPYNKYTFTYSEIESVVETKWPHRDGIGCIILGILNWTLFVKQCPVLALEVSRPRYYGGMLQLPPIPFIWRTEWFIYPDSEEFKSFFDRLMERCGKPPIRDAA